MEKTIEISPEWILSEIPTSHLVDGKGNVNIYTTIAFDGCWLKLALTTLKIEFMQLDWYSDESSFFVRYEFKIADIREDCPDLYERLKATDDLLRYHENN
jgi:hypothetical protein